MPKLYRPFLPALLCGISPLDAAPSATLPAFSCPDKVPDGLAPSDWQSIRDAYEAGRHAFMPAGGGWQARNPGDFLIQFPNPDPTGAKLLSFAVEATIDPARNQWVSLTDNDSGPGYFFGLTTAENPRAFFRLRVAAGTGP